MNEIRTDQRTLPAWALHAGLLLLSLAFVLVILHLLTPVYMENDDVAIMDYAAQGFSMPYAGIFFTSLLHLAYLRFPETAWYAMALYGLHVLALYIWLTLVFRVFRPVWLAALFALLLLGYYLVFLLYLDYTSTSIMLCTASLTWAYLDVMERRAGYLRYLLPELVFIFSMYVAAVLGHQAADACRGVQRLQDARHGVGVTLCLGHGRRLSDLHHDAAPMPAIQQLGEHLG